MIGYVMVGTNNLDASAKFYDAVLDLPLKVIGPDVHSIVQGLISFVHEQTRLVDESEKQKKKEVISDEKLDCEIQNIMNETATVL